MSGRPPRAPSPPARPLTGHALLFRRDPLGFLRDTADHCGGLARLRMGPLTFHLVTDPGLVAEVLQTRAANYVRDGRSARQMRLVTGESLLSTSGETWRRHRRLAQPVFHHRRLASLADVTLAACEETAQRWRQAAQDGRTLDLASELNRLLFSIVGRSLFGSELGGRAAGVESAYPVLVDELFRRARSFVTMPLWLPTSRHRHFRRALALIDDIVAELITARRAQGREYDDLLGVLLAARDEDGSALSEVEIRNHVITFLLAGHETTASTLTWAFCLLDRNAGTRAEIATELRAVLGENPVQLDALPRLSRLNAALSETLRLYPAIWIAERRVVAADALGGFAIPAGSTVLLSAYVTQRLAALWPEPDAFRPERFLAAASPPGVGQGYCPFGAGPHQCIGQHFALLEARIVLATLLSRFRVRLLGEFPEPLGGITLRPSTAVPVRIEI